MTDNNWQFSAYLKLYGKDGLQVSFTVNAGSVDEQANLLGEFLTRMTDGEGFSITPEGIKPGEKLQEVDAWVLGETSEGHRCIHLYKTPLQWKVATIYEERIKDIPITLGKNTFQWPGAAPDRESAERRNALTPCNFTIVLVPTGKTSDKGNPILKFDRVVGFSPAGGNAKSSKSGDVQSYSDLYNLLKADNKKLADWCRDKQKTEKAKADPTRIAILCEEIDNITGEEGTGDIVLEVLTGIPAPDIRGGISSYVTNGLIKWLSPYVLKGGETVENADRRPAYVEIIKYIWGMANGYNEVNSKAAAEAAETVPASQSSSKSGGKKQQPNPDNWGTDEDIPF